MTAKEINRAVVKHMVRTCFVVPNFYVPNWWECDVFVINKSGFFHEFEIKISRGDFRADQFKRKIGHDPEGLNHRLAGPGKHELLSAGDIRGPSKFWFVAPPGVIPIADLPDFAGLMECSLSEPWSPNMRPRVRLEALIPAPRLHRTKLSDEIRRKAEVSCYYRMHILLNQLDKEENEQLVTPVAIESTECPT